MGKKKVNVTVHSKEGTEQVELEVDEELLEPVEDFWCECTEETESHYWPDEFDDEGKRTSKHHWTCATCGLVKQIG
jgi:hypothetical protein